MARHEDFMAIAIESARNPGLVEPNPQVGAVIVQAGVMVAKGRHEYFGGPHAEVNALRKAGDRARGATLYVTLAPCCPYGKTPPCTDAIIAAGVAHVVIAAPDPTQPHGVEQLRKAGVRVTTGVLQEEALRLLAPFYKLRLRGKPYVIAKWAMSLDGRMAPRPGGSRWISGRESRHRVHRLRSVVDGVLVGIGTVVADDPMLTPRLDEFGERTPARRRALLERAIRFGKPPFHRIVLDSQARIPLESRLVRTAQQVKTLIAVTPKAAARRCRSLEQRGCEIVVCKARSGRVEIHDLLRRLGKRRLTNLLVEGGRAILGAFFQAEAVDEVMTFVAPKIIGGEGTLGPLDWLVPSGDSLTLQEVRVERLGSDTLMQGYTRDASEYLTSPRRR